MRLVFLGSPEPAVVVFDRLLADGHEISLVVTQPDRPVGRKQVLTPCPVAAAARRRSLPLFQPTSWKDSAAQDELVRIDAEAAIVVAYGRILPAAILSVPHHGFLNVHFSLLPRHRGASPVAAAILAGDPSTGVSIMRLDAGLDTGPVLDRAPVPLDGTERSGELTQRLAELGAERLSRLLERLTRGELVSAERQDDSFATICRPIEREEGRIDWSRSAFELERRFRAFDPWPGLFTTLEGARVKILEAQALPAAGDRSDPGTILRIEGDELVVATGEGEWAIRRLQPEGRSALSVGEWARGRKLSIGMRFGVR